jgi:hypothetical protein
MKMKVMALWLLIVSCCWLVMLAGTPAQEKKPAPPQSYALLIGSCFDEKGLSLPGVSVLAKLKASSNPKLSKGRWPAVSSPRGEFALRLPAGANTFVVAVKRAGFKPQEKDVTFSEDERQDVVFMLEPLTPGK